MTDEPVDPPRGDRSSLPWLFAPIPEELLFHPAVSNAGKVLWAALYRYVDTTGIAWPSQAHLARRLGWSERTVRRTLHELAEGGWVEVQRRGLTMSNVYRLVVPEPPEPPDNLGPCERPPGDGQPPLDGQGLASTDRQPVADHKGKRPSYRENTPRDVALVDTAGQDIEVVDPFDEWWGTYPRKVGKPQGARAYAKARKHASPELLLEGLARWVTYWTARNEPQFIPHPATWLNREGWNDTPPPLPRDMSRLDALSVLDDDDDYPPTVDQVLADGASVVDVEGWEVER